MRSSDSACGPTLVRRADIFDTRIMWRWILA